MLAQIVPDVFSLVIRRPTIVTMSKRTARILPVIPASTLFNRSYPFSILWVACLTGVPNLHTSPLQFTITLTPEITCPDSTRTGLECSSKLEMN